MPSPDIRDGHELRNMSLLSQKNKPSIGGPGGPDILTFAGVPTMAAKKGSLCVDITNAKLYICTVAAGTWVVVGTQV